MKKQLVGFFVLLSLVSQLAVTPKAEAARPATIKCDSITDVGGMSDMLYKNANVHGGRGRSLLDQDHQLKGTRTLYVAGLNGKVFSCFGLYRCDRPFGCRYYQAMCGERMSNGSFANKSRSLGGATALVSNGKGKCFGINTTAARYGSVRK